MRERVHGTSILPTFSPFLTSFRRSSHWPEQLAICDIINRTATEDGGWYVYDVEWRWKFEKDSPPQYEHGIPHSAIRFIDKPWQNDQQLPKAFRHPMRFPDEMTPEMWKWKA